MDHLDEWNQHNRDAKRFRDVADLIGSTHEKHAEIPCKAALVGGDKIDFCILYKISYHPEISWSSFPIKNILYADSIESIEQSKYALSLEYRLALGNAREIHNLYAPVNLMINDELYFRYMGNKKFFNLFFKYKEYDASRIISVNQDIENYNHPTEHEDLKDRLTIILCDEI